MLLISCNLCRCLLRVPHNLELPGTAISSFSLRHRLRFPSLRILCPCTSPVIFQLGRRLLRVLCQPCVLPLTLGQAGCWLCIFGVLPLTLGSGGYLPLCVFAACLPQLSRLRLLQHASASCILCEGLRICRHSHERGTGILPKIPQVFSLVRTVLEELFIAASSGQGLHPDHEDGLSTSRMVVAFVGKTLSHR